MKTLVLGGAKSGKSSFAQTMAEERARANKLIFVATAQAHDQEMLERIAAHQNDRGPEWNTIEEPLDVAKILVQAKTDQILLVDCLTLWLSNMMAVAEDEGMKVEKAIVGLVNQVANCKASVILVANEVGLGIVPANALARRYRDLAGKLNQNIAQVVDEVYFIAAGLSLKMK